MPITRMTQPIATARCGFRLLAAICVTADAAKLRHAIRPASAWLSMPDDADQKRRRHRGEQTGHREAGERGESGDDEDRARFGGHRQPLQADLAVAWGSFRDDGTAIPASTASPMCTTKLSFSGSGAYSTSSPASSGPMPRPPMLTTVATAAARVRQLSGRLR